MSMDLSAITQQTLQQTQEQNQIAAAENLSTVNFQTQDQQTNFSSQLTDQLNTALNEQLSQAK